MPRVSLDATRAVERELLLRHLELHLDRVEQEADMVAEREPLEHRADETVGALRDDWHARGAIPPRTARELVDSARPERGQSCAGAAPP